MWTKDRELEGGYPTSDGIRADWSVWLRSAPPQPGLIVTHMLIQFGSRAVSREQAEEIVGKVLAGLNAP
jgi:hypothetical protein